MKHSEVYADHKYLWSIAEAHDMTGGYVDQDDLDILLKNPSKKTAKTCLISQIEYWFENGPDIDGDNGGNPHDFEEEHPRIREIAEKYNINY